MTEPEGAKPEDRVQVSVKEVEDKGKGKARIPHWKLVMFIVPLLLAVVIAASKVRDGWHHPFDVIFGAMVGSLFALMAYRMMYKGIWQQKTNHLAREVYEEPKGHTLREAEPADKGYFV